MKTWKLLLFNIAVAVNTSFASPILIDEVSAIVNNDVVLKSDIYHLMQFAEINANKSNQQLSDNNKIILEHHALEHLIIDQIILQISQKTGVKISDEQLDQMIIDIAKQNKMTVDQIRDHLAYEGISYATYRNQICKKMLISELLNTEVRRRITILPQELDVITKQVSNKNNGSVELNLSYVLIPLSKNSSPNQSLGVENKIRSIINYVRNQNNFNRLLILYSADQQGLKYGQIGWKCIQDLPLIFVQVLNKARKGDVVGPIRSDIGFYILKVNDLRIQRESIYITELHIRHILLKPSPLMTDDQARTKLEQIAENIKSGKIAFAKAAKEFSQDLSSANQGGDLGWLTDIYDSNMREVLICMDKGQISAPVHSSSGWHLIEILDTRKVDKTNELQKARAYNILFNRKFSEEAKTWVQEQRANAYVKILNN